jgi:hypothetical protein
MTAASASGWLTSIDQSISQLLQSSKSLGKLYVDFLGFFFYVLFSLGWMAGRIEIALDFFCF